MIPMIYRVALLLVVLFAAYVAYSGYGAYESWHAKSAIFTAPADTAIGPEDADLTVVEFMDYACEHCRAIHPVLMQAVKEDGHVKLIARPLLSAAPDGSRAARLAYTATTLGKFEGAHDYLITHFGTIDEAFMKDFASSLGIDEAALDKAFENPETDKAVRENFRLFGLLGGQATPTFFIGPDKIYIPYDGMPSAEDFKTMFNQARKG